MFPELIQNPTHDLNIRLSRIFGVDQNVIQIYDPKMLSFSIRILLTYLINMAVTLDRLKDMTWYSKWP